MKKYTLFYSWQSDRPNIKKMIGDKLKSIKNELEKEDVCLVLDQDTRDRVGTENIDQSVLQKIGTCDIFVADITPVAKLEPRREGAHEKLLPNSNVMYEYGYMKGLGKMNRCILFANLDDGENREDLPFDVNHDTITEIKTEYNLRNLKNWILKIAKIVDEERNVAQPSLDVTIRFEGLVDEVTINPQFIERQYVHYHYAERSKDTYNKPVNPFGSSLDIIEATLKRLEPPVAQAPIFKPVTKKTFLDRCHISFVVCNNMNSALTNCKVYITRNQEDVCFFDSNIEESLFPRIKSVGGISVSDYQLFRYWNTINPMESLGIGEAFISVPHNSTEVVLNWHISSAQGNAFGQLLVKVVPSIEQDYIENDSLAGESRIEGKVIAE